MQSIKAKDYPTSHTLLEGHLKGRRSNVGNCGEWGLLQEEHGGHCGGRESKEQ